jgi:hypothetical protein
MADLGLLSSRAIMGMYFARLETNPGMGWIDGVSNLFGSDQASETYNFLGQSPAMREWIGGRQAKGFPARADDRQQALRGDARDQEKGRAPRQDRPDPARINEFADRGQTHWASLLSTLCSTAPTTSAMTASISSTPTIPKATPARSRTISVDISTAAGACMAVDDRALVEEMQQAILQGIAQILASRTIAASR